MSGMLLMCNTYTHTDVYFCNPQIGNTGVFSLKLTISLSFCSQLQDLSLQISKHFYICSFPCSSSYVLHMVVWRQHKYSPALSSLHLMLLECCQLGEPSGLALWSDTRHLCEHMPSACVPMNLSKPFQNQSLLNPSKTSL